MTNVIFFKLVKFQGQKVKCQQKDLITIFMWIIKTLALTIQMLLTREVFKNRPDSKVNVKNVSFHGKNMLLEISKF